MLKPEMLEQHRRGRERLMGKFEPDFSAFKSTVQYTVLYPSTGTLSKNLLLLFESAYICELNAFPVYPPGCWNLHVPAYSTVC